MLVIPRKVGEGVVVGEDITITVLGIQDDSVQFGIEHPVDVQVDGEALESNRLADGHRLVEWRPIEN
jgi:carbon storage regulator